jgi:mitogen-activated protein kinase 15
MRPSQAYGVVWKARDRHTNTIVALKKIFDAFQNATDAQVPVPTTAAGIGTWPRLTPCACCAVQRTFREVMFLSELQHHPNIIR